MKPFNWLTSADFWTPSRLVFKGKVDQLPELEDIKQQKNTESNSACDDIRRKVNQLLNTDGFRETLDQEAIKGYEQMVNKEGFIKPDDFPKLKSSYEFMEKGWEKVQAGLAKMNEHIEQAVAKKIISKDDIDFYKENLAKNVFNGKNIVDDKFLEKTEKELTDSLKKRVDEKDEFDKLQHHPLVKEGKLTIGKGQEVVVPDETGYLKMSVPDRRKFLEKIQEHLKKAEAYSKIQEGVEAPQLTAKYTSLLTQARDVEKVMGQATVDEFLTEFEKQPTEEKKYWIQEMANGNQLERYRDLWGDIRSTFPEGEAARNEMENARDQMGWTELFNKFGQLKQAESARLNGAYEQKLNAMHQQKVISDETLRSFMEDGDGIESQDLQGKYYYMQEFDRQMEPYQELRSNIDAIEDKKIKDELNKMYSQPKQGYTEIYDRYIELTESDMEEGGEEGEDEKVLNRIPDVTRREGIVEAVEMLDTPEALQDMLEMVERMLEGENEEGFNGYDVKDSISQIVMSEAMSGEAANDDQETGGETADSEADPRVTNRVISFQKVSEERGQKPKNSFFSRFLNRSRDSNEEEVDDRVISIQDRIRQRRQSQMPEIKNEEPAEELYRKENNQPMDQDEVAEQMEIASEKGLATFEHEGFRQVENKQGRRVTIVNINDQPSLDHLMRTNRENPYKGVQHGGSQRDYIHFTISRNNGNEIDLELRDLQAMQQYLKAKIQRQVMQKAA